jgi:hypothetical protein
LAKRNRRGVNVRSMFSITELTPQIWGDLERASPTLCSALMDQKIIIDRALVRAEQLVLEGDRLIAQQNELIDQMLKLGVHVSVYREALARFEQNQTLRVQRVDTLRQDLSDGDSHPQRPCPPPSARPNRGAAGHRGARLRWRGGRRAPARPAAPAVYPERRLPCRSGRLGQRPIVSLWRGLRRLPSPGAVDWLTLRPERSAHRRRDALSVARALEVLRLP